MRHLIFFSGFGFTNEQTLFEKYLPRNASDTTIAGFSLGAIRAFMQLENSKKRVDRLLLLSPAFFQDKDDAFKRLQLQSFVKNPQQYMDIFYRQCGNCSDVFHSNDYNKNDLELLLNFQWDKIALIRYRNIKIDIILGGKDNIISAQNAMEFFGSCGANITYIKNANHLLQIKEN